MVHGSPRDPDEYILSTDAIREALGWLGECKRNQAGHSMHLVFRFSPEVDPQSTLKLKVEINTREHENLFGIRHYPFAVENDWYQGQADIASFEAKRSALKPDPSRARENTYKAG